MLFEPTVIKTIRHPFVSSAYIVKGIDRTGSIHSVLVIQPTEAVNQNDLYQDFLENLDLITEQVGRNSEPFDRVDIRFH